MPPRGEDLHAVERDILRALVDREGAEARREVGRTSACATFERSGVQGVVDDLARATGGRAVLRDGSGLVVASAGAAARRRRGDLSRPRGGASSAS